MDIHTSVLLNETIEQLNIKPNGIYVDCTLGFAGHSSEILKQLTSGHLYAFDQDKEAISFAEKKLSAISNQFTIINSNFVNLKESLASLGITKVDGILFDLGVSSYQFDQPQRGFSYKKEAELDMRMNQEAKLSAYQIVNEYSLVDLSNIFYQYGEEKYAKSIARRIVEKRTDKPITTTLELVDIIKEAIPKKELFKQKHPARKVFQALRIEVNDEINVFKQALDDAISLLSVNGRVAVITFHSIEDRICKHTFLKYTKDDSRLSKLPVVEEKSNSYKLITRKPIIPTIMEIDNNKRARSSKLRILERTMYE